MHRASGVFNRACSSGFDTARKSLGKPMLAERKSETRARDEVHEGHQATAEGVKVRRCCRLRTPAA